MGVCIRPFVWTKKNGFGDLWDLADRTRDVEPKAETFNVSAAISPDGKTIAALGGRLYIIHLK